MLTSAPKTNHIVAMIRKEYPGYHPLLSIARIAHMEGVDLELQFNCHKVIAKYIEPELKSIEMSGEVTKERRVKVSLFSDDVELIEDVTPRDPVVAAIQGSW